MVEFDTNVKDGSQVVSKRPHLIPVRLNMKRGN